MIVFCSAKVLSRQCRHGPSATCTDLRRQRVLMVGAEGRSLTLDYLPIQAPCLFKLALLAEQERVVRLLCQRALC